MIQELLGSGDIKKISTNGAVFESSPPSSSTLPATSSSETQKLRCPRCDSSNTKFCYYNNYNLTQPRHFCKTCRRYWTKGGALRNVPIGGGCRKNRSIPAASASAAGKSSTTAVAFKTAQTSEIGRSEQITNPWVSPQNSHILALLRATQNPNPNPNPNPNLGLCSSFWRNNQHDEAQHQHHPHHQQQINGNIVGEVQNSGMQELYQRLRLSTSFYGDQAPVVLSNVGFSSSSSSSSTILESAPVAGGDFGYWNPAFSWSDLSTTTNGAYP